MRGGCSGDGSELIALNAQNEELLDGDSLHKKGDPDESSSDFHDSLIRFDGVSGTM